MKKSLLWVVFLSILVLLSCLGFIFLTNVNFSEKNLIKVSDWQLINESGCGNSLNLIDEFDPKGFSPKTFWKPSEHKVCHGEKYSLIINFEAIVKCEYLYIFSSGFGDILISKGQSANQADKQSLIYGWNKLKTNFNTDFIYLQLLSDINIGALIVEGSFVTKPKDRIFKVNYPLLKDFLGINALVDDPLGAMDVARHIREYHETVWHQLGDDNFNFSPSFAGFEFEPFYSNFGKAGYSITPVIQHSGKWITGSDNGEAIPCAVNHATTDPSSYKGHAYLLHQILKNYKLKGTPLKYIENWNEPDKSWHGKEAYISPYEYAAFSSMDYDGHKNGNIPSIINGDSNTVLVMAGLTDLRSDYINALHHWCKTNRSGKFPWGVINTHVYANDPIIKSGITPEKFHLQQKVSAFVLSSKQVAPNAQVWLSEFGYDRKDDSPQHVPTIEGYTSDEVQAILLLRSFLLLSTTGLDKAYQYMLRDTKGKGTYASSGLYKTENGVNKLLPSWYYLKTLQDVLGDYRFSKRIDLGNQEVYLLEFFDGKHKAYAAWMGTEQKSESVLNLPLGFGLGQKLWMYSCNNVGPSAKTTQAFTNDFKLKITDNPTFILDTLINEKIAKKIKKEEIEITAQNAPFFDENDKVDPLFQSNQLVTSLHEDKITDVKLKSAKYLSHLSIFDDQGQSDLRIEVFYKDKGVTVFEGKTTLYKKWKSFILNEWVEKIVFSHKTNTSKIGEVVLYEY